MAIEKVLVAYDESDGAKKALAVAADFAVKDPAMTIDLAYVVPIPVLDNQRISNFKEILDMMIEDGKTVLDEAIESAGEIADRISPVIITGTNPATELVKLANENGYDLVVIGSRGLTGIKEYIGSVSHKVLSAVGIPVLIAK